MGIMRKTLSIGTLGLVSFRSKKEKLRRAERAHREAEETLSNERESRARLETRISEAEKAVNKTSLEAIALAKRLDQERRSRRAKRRERVNELVSAAEPAIRSAGEAAVSGSREAAKRGRKLGRRAKVAAVSAKDAIEPQVERAVGRVEDLVDSARSR